MKKTTAQLKVGHTIKVWWSPGRDTITALRPCTGPLLVALNPSGMTLGASAIFEVV